MKSQIDNLQEALDLIKQGMFELIDHSRILRFESDPSADVVFKTPEFYWDVPTLKEQEIQTELKQKYIRWIQLFKMIIEDAPESVWVKMIEIDSFIMNWIEKGSDWELPGTLKEAKTKFEEKITPLFETLTQYFDAEDGSIILIPDTRAMISNLNPLAYKECIHQEKFTLAILPAVLRELDELKMKSWDEEFRKKVRTAVKRIERFENRGNLQKGITIQRTIRIKLFPVEPDFTKASKWLDEEDNEDRIIASAMEVQRTNPSDIVMLASADSNLQNKAEMAYFPYVKFE